MAKTEEPELPPAGGVTPPNIDSPQFLGDAWSHVDRLVYGATPLGQVVHGVELLGVRAMCCCAAPTGLTARAGS